MEIKLDIPEYLSIKQWKQFTSMEHLSESEKMTKLVALLGGVEEKTIRTWTPTALTQVYAKVLESLQDLDPQFYPVFELDGVKYGYTSMTSMTLGEYVDLERLAIKPYDNIEEILAILYRPITKHRFGSIKWAFKSTYKIALGDAENLFKYYTTEDYDSGGRATNAEKLSGLPASMALGALGFFLVLGSSYLVNTHLSSMDSKEKMTAMKQMNKQMDSMSIGAGLLQFITSLQHPSLTSQGNKLLQTSISSSYLTTWPLSKIRTIGMSRLENNKKELIKLDNE